MKKMLTLLMALTLMMSMSATALAGDTDGNFDTCKVDESNHALFCDNS